MLELYQIENCPYCDIVRDTLEALGLDYVVRPVPADRDRRDRVREISGQTLVPVLVDGERRVVVHDSSRIIAYLNEHYGRKR